jgi:nucleolar protein 14
VSLAPRFDESYAGVKRSLTEKEEQRRLAKAVKREEKGAARELKRDSEFLARVRDEEKDKVKEAAKSVRVKNFGWMEEQQATLNLQVRKGRGLAGGGSSIKKSVAAVLKSGKRQS